MEFRLGLGGKNYAKLAHQKEVDPESTYALSCARCVDPAEGVGDEELVSTVLREAATWGDASLVRESQSVSVLEQCCM